MFSCKDNTSKYEGTEEEIIRNAFSRAYVEYSYLEKDNFLEVINREFTYGVYSDAQKIYLEWHLWENRNSENAVFNYEFGINHTGASSFHELLMHIVALRKEITTIPHLKRSEVVRIHSMLDDLYTVLYGVKSYSNSD